MSITVDFGWKTSRVVLGIILILLGIFMAVGSYVGIFGAVWSTGLTTIGEGIGVVVAVAGLLVIFTARKQMKGQAREVDVKFVPKN